LVIAELESRGIAMRRVRASVLVLLVWLAAFAAPAHAEEPAERGRIAYSRFDPSTGEPRITVADPNGMHTHVLALPFPSDNPVWSPDGNRILLFVFRPDGPPRPATVASDGSDFRVLEVPAMPPDVDIRCTAWSPYSVRLLCQISRAAGGDPVLNGIYTIRASDGGGVRRLTTNPYPPSGDFGGGDIPGDFSPDGSRFVFMRAKPGPEPTPDIGQSGALFVGKSDGSDVRQITQYGVPNSHDNGLARWSPDGNKILFASEQGELMLVRPGDTHLTQIDLKIGGETFAFSPGWSPDGKRIVTSVFVQQSGQEDIYTADSDGTHPSQVTNTSDFEDFANWARHTRR
jgi:Tol biopolymer transport system component